MDKEIEKQNCQKYIKFHRLHILAILFVVFYETGRYLNNPFIGHSYLTVPFLYLLVPKWMDRIFKCSKNLYIATFLFTAFFFGGAGPSVKLGIDRFLKFFSEYSLYAGTFIFFNSIFMSARVRGMGIVEFIESETINRRKAEKSPEDSP